MGNPSTEFGLIDWIRARAAASDRVPLGIGDDCAAIPFTPGMPVLATTDMLMDGRHFRLGEATAAQVGYKALAVNLSDIAAMAGVPVAALISVALPRDGASEIARGLIEGMNPLAKRFGVSIAGGDTNAWDGPLVINIALLGEATDRGPARRSGARPGDPIFVTGPLGGSLLGRHLHPEPRIDEALRLNHAVEIRAMIDVSDGLASDLGHILDESGGLGAVLDEPAIPIHPDALAMSREDGRSPLDHALNDGEDFELCVVLEPGEAARALGEPGLAGLIRRIGVITAGPGFWLRGADALLSPIRPAGFDHLRGGR